MTKSFASVVYTKKREFSFLDNTGELRIWDFAALDI